MPDLRTIGPVPSETQRWLGRAYALVHALSNLTDISEFQHYTNFIGSHSTATAANHLERILYRALALAELSAPASARGSFIPAGGVFDVFSALSKVFAESEKDVLIIDPYLDEKVMTDFASLVAEGVNIRLLADCTAVKASLGPAVTRWNAQYGATRPVNARLSESKVLHDRLIINDSVSVWVLTQSFNAIAARSPATIVRLDADTANLKIDAYSRIWENSKNLK